MFSRKCERCREKLGKNFHFCPHCGYKAKKGEGLLDEIDESVFNDLLSMKMPAGFDAIFRELSKSLNEVDKNGEENRQVKKLPGISITISSFNGENPKIQVKTFSPEKGPALQKPREQKSVFFHNKLNARDQEEMAKLPKIDPETKVRRLTDKVVYEINIAGVNSLDKVVINKMQNSIEIRALAKDRAYFKLIPVSLQLRKYYLEEEKLVLELSPNY